LQPVREELCEHVVVLRTHHPAIYLVKELQVHEGVEDQGHVSASVYAAYGVAECLVCDLVGDLVDGLAPEDDDAHNYHRPGGHRDDMAPVNLIEHEIVLVYTLLHHVGEGWGCCERDRSESVHDEVDPE